jgi:hypothetical protein
MAILTSISSPADVANNAFIRMGFRLRVGPAGWVRPCPGRAERLRPDSRRAAVDTFDYDFAERTLALTQLKAAPIGGYFPPNLWNPATHPPTGYLYEYAWPDNAIKIRSLKRQPLFAVNYDPQPVNFSEYNDRNYTPAQRTIVANIPNAIAVYTGRITDPSTWSVQFAEALAARLAVVLGPALVGLQASQITMAEAQQADAASMVEQR